MDEKDLAIKVEHVSKVYRLYDKPTDRLKESLGLTRKRLSKDHYALNDLNFEIKKGETVGIIGTNGAGKSTILKIITGVLTPTQGNVDISGRISALLELGAGFNMEYTGIENIYLNGTMMGFSKEEVDARMDDILKFADIGDFVNQPCKTYSSGMFVRLAFAVAINIDPEILIVDEALSVGDVFFQAKCYNKFEEFKKMGKTILFVSHDLGSIGRYCDRVILLNQGSKLSEGSPREMVDMYKKLIVNQLDLDNPEQDMKTNDGESDEAVLERVSAEIDAQYQNENTWKSQLTLNPIVQDYGEKKAIITDVAIIDKNGHITNVIEQGTEFEVKMRVEVQEEIEQPIFALTFKSLQGNDLTGTNTLYEGMDTGTVHKGDVRIITFRQKMNLLGGEYLVSFGCTGYIAGDFHVYHRLYDFCNITVVAHQLGVGFYNMFSDVKVIEG